MIDLFIINTFYFLSEAFHFISTVTKRAQHTANKKTHANIKKHLQIKKASLQYQFGNTRAANTNM